MYIHSLFQIRCICYAYINEDRKALAISWLKYDSSYISDDWHWSDLRFKVPWKESLFVRYLTRSWMTISGTQKCLMMSGVTLISPRDQSAESFRTILRVRNSNSNLLANWMLHSILTITQWSISGHTRIHIYICWKYARSNQFQILADSSLLFFSCLLWRFAHLSMKHEE